MNPFRLRSLPHWVLTALLAGSVLVPILRAARAPAELLNFADYRRDPDGTTMRPYEYAYGDWNKHTSPFRNQGTLIQAPSGNGGMGDNHASLNLNGMVAIDLILVIGNENQATALSFYIEDNDGTGQAWNLPLAEKRPGENLHFRLELAKPDFGQKEGKKPGLNLKKISVWQLRGDQKSPRVEVLALKLVESP